MIKMKRKKQTPSCSYCHVFFNRHNGICKTCGKNWNRKLK